MSYIYRILILTLASTTLLGWVVKHAEPSSSLGLRYIQQAEKIERGLWHEGLFGGVDQPLHPLLIVAAHDLVGGTGPGSWQRAALVLSFAAGVLLIIPVYLLALELFGENAAWLASLLVAINPIIGYVVVNVLSESTFLLWWTFGLWGAVRFLRSGRFLWLLLAIGLGALAYLTRPEGMLLPSALVLTLLTLPLLRATRINWPRWWRALAFALLGLALLLGPYSAIKGGFDTGPGVARVLGLAPQAHPSARDRERPLLAERSTIDTYRDATMQTLEVLKASVTPPLFVFALLGLAVACRLTAHVRTWLFLGMVLAASAIALVRLHATGICTVRHAVVPGLILNLAAAHGLVWLTSKISIPGRWLGKTDERLAPGPAVWGTLVALFIVIPNMRFLGPLNPGPYSVYHAAGRWLTENTRSDEQVLDLTDWALYFSRRDGYHFAEIDQAPADPRTRWIVVREPNDEGTRRSSQILYELIGGRQPVALVPARAARNQIQLFIYDRLASVPSVGTSPNASAAEILRR